MWAMCASLVAISTTNPFYLLPLFAVCLFVYALKRRAGYERGFRMFVVFGLVAMATRTLLVVFGEISLEAVVAAALEGLRLAVLLAVYGALNAVTDPYRFLRLAPRRFHEPALAAALALSIAPRTIDAVGRVREAQRLRGMDIARWRSFPALAVPVLETGMEEAVTLAESMDARGHGRGSRSRYRPQRWRAEAWATCIAAAAALFVFLANPVDEASTLEVSTYPLRWPTASLLYVVAVLVLATPAAMPEDRAR